MKKIVKGDRVMVRCGRDKGKQGVVLSCIDAEHVLVEGINVVKRHTKPNPAKGVAGGIVVKSLPIHISNVGLFNPATLKAARTTIKLIDGKKSRVFAGTDTRVPVV